MAPARLRGAGGRCAAGGDSRERRAGDQDHVGLLPGLRPPCAPEARAARPTTLQGSRGRVAEPEAVRLDPPPGHPRQAVSLWKALQTRQWRRDSDEDAAANGLRFSFAAVDHLKLRIDENNAAWQGLYEG